MALVHPHLINVAHGRIPLPLQPSGSVMKRLYPACFLPAS
jgi:hypothetical protein